eukprot:TRINITY_DN2754_c0_g1_i2.p1 TRINITY_DN2754_c0_g1~~TRINITY_DN2754_c0_g1_i2.p1  ORF type:complete len:226 (-),score=4.54 TRINITY_DN2754_c0_g1_i2:48-725(-)
MCLSGEILSVFISWVMDQRKAFDIHGSTISKISMLNMLFELKDWLMNPFPFPPHFLASYPILYVETKENLLEKCSEVATGTDSNTICESGEFYLEMAEWDSICVTDWNGKMSLEGNWTNIFADKFHDINNMCVLKFKNYWFKKIDSRKVNSPLLRARAECKFDNLRVYIFHIEDEISSIQILLLLSSVQKNLFHFSIQMVQCITKLFTIFLLYNICYYKSNSLSR